MSAPELPPTKHSKPSPAAILDTSPISPIISLIEQRTGLSATTQRRADLTSLLQRLAGDNLVSFIQRLRGTDDSSPEWQAVINAITIGETYFLRDKTHFRLLRETILPQLSLRRRQENRQKLNVWCVGCSTGEEPYSIAITLYEFLPDLAKWDITIIGSDINARSIEIARKGVYRPWSFRGTDETFQQRYFEPIEGGFQIQPQLRDMVTFQRANILSSPPLPHFDIVFCRNMMLYFSPERINRAEDNLYNALIPSGWLMLGQSEALRFHRERWNLHIFPGTPIYQKPLSDASPQAQPVRYGSISISTHKSQPQADIPEIEREYLEAVAAIRNDQHDEATHHLTRILALQPGHAAAHTLLATLFANRQARPEAYAHIDAALKQMPLFADAHYVKAMLDLESGDTDAAIRSLHATLYCDRNHALAAFTLGNVYTTQGDLPRGHRHWQNASRAISQLAPDTYLSDTSEMTARILGSLLSNQLDQN